MSRKRSRGQPSSGDRDRPLRAFESEVDRVFDQVLSGVPTPLKLFIALVFVIALIVVATWLTRRFGGHRMGAAALSGRSRQPRLGVLDVLAVDGRRRLVIVRRDNVEHLVMIGGPNDFVVESGILRVPAGATAQRELPLGPSLPEPAPRSAAPQPAPALNPTGATRSVPAIGALPAAPQLRPIDQPVRAPRSVEAPPIVPSPMVTTSITPPPPPSKGPAAPKPAPVVPASKPTSPAAAAPPSPVESAPAKPSPSPAPAIAETVEPEIAKSELVESKHAESRPVESKRGEQKPFVRQPVPAAAVAIAAAPAKAGIASTSDIAERLAAALKRPVAAQSRTPKALAPTPEPQLEAIEADVAEAPVVELEKPDASRDDADVLTFSADGDRIAPDVTTHDHASANNAAPDVKPETRAEADGPADNEDPFSLEADLAALLGRDMGKTKS